MATATSRAEHSMWKDWDSPTPAVWFDSCCSVRGYDIWCCLCRKSQRSDFPHHFLLDDPASRPEERGHQQLARQKEIFLILLFSPSSGMYYYYLQGQSLSEQRRTSRLAAALSMARAELQPHRGQGQGRPGCSKNTVSFSFSFSTYIFRG